MASYAVLSRLIKSRPLFYYLVGKLQPRLVLDVGSRDGTDALGFRRRAPQSRIVCVEANPDLAASMEADSRLREARIEVRHCAASSETGEARFYIFNEERGTGSILPRQTGSLREMPVPARRLDELVEMPPAGEIALWIDTEGATYEALVGAEGLLPRVAVVHAEIELKAVWEGQHLASEVLEWMDRRGFDLIHLRMKQQRPEQGNAIFLRRNLGRRSGLLASMMGFAAVHRLRLRHA